MNAPHTLDSARLGEHIGRLMRAAWALTGTREAAEDLVQETLVQVLAKPRQVHADDDIAYLLRALRNTYVSTRRSASRRPQLAAVDPDDLAFAATGHAAAPSAADVAETRLVYAAIAELPERFREVVVAIDVAGLSYRETAQALGVREATVTTRLFRGRDRLARALAA
ncbi:MAG: RNA polymerase sigma factor [Solirubrobacteraceae bacterium]|nr:MAG: RNA polymerase subunit sigma [Solirubrobacterales bacterium]